jgi:hypothetical protein
MPDSQNNLRKYRKSKEVQDDLIYMIRSAYLGAAEEVIRRETPKYRTFDTSACSVILLISKFRNDFRLGLLTEFRQSYFPTSKYRITSADVMQLK